jgi:type IV pilus assembly protein PilQ
MMFVSLFLPVWVAAMMPQVESLKIRPLEGESGLSVELILSQSVPFESFTRQDGTEWVLDLQGATLPRHLERTIELGGFYSNLLRLTPLNRASGVRLILHLKEKGENVVVESLEENSQLALMLKVGPRGVTRSQAAPEDLPALPGDENKEDPPSVPDPLPEEPSGSIQPEPLALPKETLEAKAEEALPSPLSAVEKTTSPPASPLQEKLDRFIQSQKKQQFVGKKITLQVRDVHVTDVLKMIGEYSGFNMVISDAVKGQTTLSLTDVPWDQALDLVLKTHRLGAERNANVLRVLPLLNLKEEKEEEERVRSAAMAATPLVTRVFPINYARLGELQETLARLVGAAAPTPTGTAPAAGGPPAQGGATPATGGLLTFVQADARTNSLIIRDTEDNLERMKKLIDILDTQTPQIMIEARIVEATEGFARSLTGAAGTSGGILGQSGFVGSFLSGNPTDQLFGGAGIFSGGAAAAQAAKGSSSLLGLSLDFIPGLSRLNTFLSLGESENQVRTISAPKTVVLNRERASIIQGTPVLVPQTQTLAGVGTSLVYAVQQANISLNVTPSVTNDGAVMMQLQVNKDTPINLAGSSQGVGNRSMTTQVLVDSGTTLVLGGIFTLESDTKSEGFPFLRKIPILGWLFEQSSSSERRSEIFIFVTPKILNSKDAGLT